MGDGVVAGGKEVSVEGIRTYVHQLAIGYEHCPFLKVITGMRGTNLHMPNMHEYKRTNQPRGRV